MSVWRGAQDRILDDPTKLHKGSDKKHKHIKITNARESPIHLSGHCPLRIAQRASPRIAQHHGLTMSLDSFVFFLLRFRAASGC